MTEQILITSQMQLFKLYDDITELGAEGIILRAPNSPYEEKRSKYFLKFKIKEDSECIVRGYEMGTGKYVGMLGSLNCELIHNKKLTGIKTNIGTGLSDLQRKEYNNPESVEYIPIGAIVSFSFMELTKDKIPRHPVYRGVRHDFKIGE